MSKEVDNLSKIYTLLRKAERYFLCKKWKSYVYRKELSRSGRCLQCGRCCRLLLRCIFLEYRDGKANCTIYQIRSEQCRAFPINQRDVDGIGKGCGFKFE